MTSGKAGDPIFEEGDAGTDMYIIRQGQVQLTKRYAGEPRQLELLEVGDFFGEMSLLEAQPREVSARAVTDYQLLRIDTSTFDRIVDEDPEIAVRMLRKLSRRLRAQQEADARAAQIARGGLVVPKEAPSTPAASAESVARVATPKRASLVESQSGTEFPLGEPKEATIGRADRSTGFVPDIDLTSRDTDKTLSRRHATVLNREGTFFLREGVTRNGTFVNGKRVGAGVEVQLENGDRIRLGRIDLTFTVR